MIGAITVILMAGVAPQAGCTFPPVHPHCDTAMKRIISTLSLLALLAGTVVATGCSADEFVGSDIARHTGTNQLDGTGTNQLENTGTNQLDGTGTNQVDGTGTNQ